MATDPRAPCLIGVARRTWRQEPAPEPLAMWETMARAAADDAGCPAALGALQSIDVVYCQSWEYDDPCARLAERLGADPARQAYSGLGGSVPVRLVADAAAAMAGGRLDLALVVGGEALATRRHLPDPAWSFAPAEARPFPLTIDRQEGANGIYQAYLTFALLDTARRAHLGRSPADHRLHLGRLLAPMTEVAASQPEHAWFPTAREAAEITTPSASNRMVATPYTKLMTAIMDVDMAAAVLLATEERADALGVPPEKRVYLRGAGAADDLATMAARPELWRSPAMEAAMAGALGPASIDDVAHLDLYSCFASSLAFAGDALGIGDDRSLTVTGGLPYHGGPGSNYDTHALAAMAETLRNDPGALGLISGVGMHMTTHSAVVLSTRPGPFAPIGSAPAPPATVPVVSDAEGTGRVRHLLHRPLPAGSGVDGAHLRSSRRFAGLRAARRAPADDVDLVGESVTLAPGKRGATVAQR